MYLWWRLCALHLHACQVSYHRQLWSLLLYMCDIFKALINSLVCLFWPFQFVIILPQKDVIQWFRHECLGEVWVEHRKRDSFVSWKLQLKGRVVPRFLTQGLWPYQQNVASGNQNAYKPFSTEHVKNNLRIYSVVLHLSHWTHFCAFQCKHHLAVKISNITGKTKILNVSDQQLADMLSAIEWCFVDFMPFTEGSPPSSDSLLTTCCCPPVVGWQISTIQWQFADFQLSTGS